MRLAVAAVLSASVAVPASAAAIDPSALVLRASAVPAGFRIDADESGLRTNEIEAKEFPPAGLLFRRWGRITGQQVMFRRGNARIEDRVDVFRGADGARKFLEFVDREAQKAGFKGQRRTAVAIGAGGWLHQAGSSYALVVWRHGRVFAGCFANGLPRARLLALARTQERRIAQALR